MRVCVFFFRRSSQRRTLGPSSTVRAFSSSSLMSWIMASWWRESRWKRERGEREKGGRKRDGEKKSGEGGGEIWRKKIRKRNLCIHLSLPADLHQQQAYHYSLSLPFYFHYSLFVSFFSMMMIYRDFTCSCKKTHPDGCVRTCPPACKESSCDMPTF